MFYINPTLYSSGIFLPGVITQKYIKMASFCAIKTLLFICSQMSGELDYESISKGIGSSVSDIKEAVDYWLNEGVLVSDEKDVRSVFVPTTSDSYLKEEKKEERPKEKKQEKQDISVKLPSPSMSEISEALENDKEFSMLCKQLQTLLGDIGFSVQAAVFSMLRGYGLPSDIIYILINYCVERDKKTTAFMLSVAKDFYKNDILTHESAYEYIDAHKKSEAVFTKFKMETGISAPKATPSQEAYISEWIKMGFSVEMMVLAYNKTVEKLGKISFGYTNKILISWHENGYKTPEDVENAEKKFSQSAKKDKPQRSYDLEKAKEKDKKKKFVYEDLL